MQKSELKSQTLKNSLNQGDLNIVTLKDPLKKNSEKSNILSHLVTCKSSKLYSPATNSDSKFFGKKYKNSPIFSNLVNLNRLILCNHKPLQAVLQAQNVQNLYKQGVITSKKPHFLSKNETLLSNCQLTSTKTQ
jgi:hypothetical protein